MNRKRKLGIIGGMGSRAGVLLLKKIIDYSPAETDQEFLEIIFHNNSTIPDRTKAIVYNEMSPVAGILRSVELFNQNEVEAIAMACITSYYYYGHIITNTAAKVLNPLHLVADYIQQQGSISRVGLLATTGTINSGLFHQEMKASGIGIVTLPPEKQESLFMRSVYMKNGYKSAHISEEAKVLMQKSIDQLTAARVDAIICGCTEVSLAVDRCVADVPYIDTLDLLARKAVDYCYNTSTNHLKDAGNGQKSNS